MRILVVGAGGVGSAVAPIAARRDFFEHDRRRRLRRDRAERTVARAGRRRAVQRRAGRRLEAPTTSPRCVARARHHPRPERGRPALRHAHLRRRLRRRRGLPRHGDVAVAAAPGEPVRRDRRQARRRAVRPGRGLVRGRAGWRWSGWASSPGCPTSSPAMPPTTSSARSTRSASATARTWSSTATTSRRRSRSGPRSRSASTRRSSGSATAAGTRPRRSASPRCSTSPRGSVRSSASTSSTRRSSSSRAGSTRRRVTFKYGLGDEFIDVLQVLHKLGLDRTDKLRVGGVEVSPRDVVAAALPDPATLGDRMRGKTCAGTLGHRDGQGRPAAGGLPLPRRRQRVVDARVRLAGRRLADGDQPGRRAGAAGRRGPGPGAGVLGPEAFDAVPFLDLLTAYGSPWGMREGG